MKGNKKLISKFPSYCKIEQKINSGGKKKKQLEAFLASLRKLQSFKKPPGNYPLPRNAFFGAPCVFFYRTLLKYRRESMNTTRAKQSIVREFEKNKKKTSNGVMHDRTKTQKQRANKGDNEESK